MVTLVRLMAWAARPLNAFWEQTKGNSLRMRFASLNMRRGHGMGLWPTDLVVPGGAESRSTRQIDVKSRMKRKFIRAVNAGASVATGPGTAKQWRE